LLLANVPTFNSKGLRQISGFCNVQVTCVIFITVMGPEAGHALKFVGSKTGSDNRILMNKFSLVRDMVVGN